MKGHRISRDEPVLSASPRLGIAVIVFFIGAVIGSFFSANLSSMASQHVELYAGSAAAQTGTEAFLQAFWPDCVLLALVFISGFTRWGILLVPGALFAKGFLFSTVVTAFIRVYGIKGYLAAFPAAFFSGFAATACLIILAMQSLSLSAQRGGRRGRLSRGMDSAYYFSAGICTALIALTAFLHSAITPMLTRSVIKIIT